MIIGNGKDRPLGSYAGTMPDVSGALTDWFAPMNFGVVTKVVVNSQVIETQVPVATMGVWQPYSDRQLQMVPYGERKWKWFTLHALPALKLQPDDVVTYLGEQYRVMSEKDYRLNGYVEYKLNNDYTGVGPSGP